MQLANAMTVKFGGKTYPVESLEDAQKKWCAFRDECGEGVSTIGNGVAVYQGKKKVAQISYNGRIWQ